MRTLTPDGRRVVQELAHRHGFGEEAVLHMFEAVAKGHGRMAQFAHVEFGGSGQWMSGGMLMLGDMFNHELKGRVNALCTDLRAALESIQSPAGGQGDHVSVSSLPTAFFNAPASQVWWPSGLGTPSATGSQDTTRYAYFSDARRLAVDLGGEIRVHDTLDHRIGGFSQQQGGCGGFSISSQHGTVELAALPVVSGGEGGGRPAAEQPAASASSAHLEAMRAVSVDAVGGERAEPTTAAESTDTVADDPIRLIERLGQLHEQGLLTDEEFVAKKQELLKRL